MASIMRALTEAFFTVAGGGLAGGVAGSPAGALNDLVASVIATSCPSLPN